MKCTKDEDFLIFEDLTMSVEDLINTIKSKALILQVIGTTRPKREVETWANYLDNAYRILYKFQKANLIITGEGNINSGPEQIDFDETDLNKNEINVELDNDVFLSISNINLSLQDMKKIGYIKTEYEQKKDYMSIIFAIKPGEMSIKEFEFRYLNNKSKMNNYIILEEVPRLYLMKKILSNGVKIRPSQQIVNIKHILNDLNCEYKEI